MSWQSAIFQRATTNHPIVKLNFETSSAYFIWTSSSLFFSFVLFYLFFLVLFLYLYFLYVWFCLVWYDFVFFNSSNLNLDMNKYLYKKNSTWENILLFFMFFWLLEVLAVWTCGTGFRIAFFATILLLWFWGALPIFMLFCLTWI